MSRRAAALLARRLLHGVAGGTAATAATGGTTGAAGSSATAPGFGAAAAVAARWGLLAAGRHTAGGSGSAAAAAAAPASNTWSNGSHTGGVMLLRAVRGFLGGSACMGAASKAVAAVAGVSGQAVARTAVAGMARAAPAAAGAAAGRGLLAGGGGRGAAVAVGAAAAVAAVPVRPSSLQFVRTAWQDGRGYVHFQGRGRTFQLPTGPRARITAVVLVGGGLSYYLYCREEVPYTHRMHSIMLVSTANEQWMGSMVFQEQKAMAQAEGRLLPDNAPDAQRVRRLGLAIAAVAGDGGGGGYQAHMQNLQWEFAVIDNPTPNAFVVPGGKVVVFTGLLRLLGHSDDELAAVLAHEVGHVLARHTAERMSTLNVWTLFNMILRLTLGFGLPNVAMYMGIFLPYSRLAEYEADRIGLRLMARACFDPTAAPHMLAKLNAKEKQMQQRGMSAPIPAFLRTHPLTEDRVRQVESDLQQAHALYLQAGCGGKRSDFARAAGGLFGPAWGGGGGGDGGGGGNSGGRDGEGEYVKIG
ncbi:hypothetical protein CHLRE_06g306650v5 [Chlamydomonas reinhardtii]|uniref:Peptidase M48 domain-containing protein n=1 Tax=Chlamydomonas reinhardtii TaxID=3055 RepID=A0A2K3DRD8_CHLRE|nr:uncharacterized protein CHLRE_06g306650v5 [Chlamydomonas reinhardtii]XP_042924427.1 uncharacterized protein CHLRE_06g306650v5 [Chlamydomonas reinhardtii]PNW83103.1 hypothetical protein CHLRE_06g306650v5 [Chlamydomonas reinhardtii]PNW83104.1 hypothetical protein CHLRE_06g306650v5 [Chlamydomonas reinhardtii]